MRMFLDTNILVHAYNKSSPMREKASALLMSALRNEARVVISPQVLFEFYSVITNPKRVLKPLPPDEAAAICLDLLASFDIEKVCSTTNTAREALSLAEELNLTGSEIFDCVLAATVRENGIEFIYTENVRDFERYEFVTAQNPLSGP